MTISQRRSDRLDPRICWKSILAVLIPLLPGCKVGPDYEPPVAEVPDAWHQSLMVGFQEGESDVRQWWRHFDDPLLDDLMERATSGNLQLAEAFARINEARALRGVARGELFPDLQGTGSAIRDRPSEDLFRPLGPGREQTDWVYSLGVDSSWELDMWGRIRRSIESADAGLTASVEDYRDLLVLLYAEMAFNYVQVRTLQARIGYARSNAKGQRDTLQLTRHRFDAQIAPELDVRQAELNLARTEALIPALESQMAEGIHRLSVLIGSPPSALYDELVVLGPIPRPPKDMTVGVPADVLRQRPDIRRAERELAAQNARIGVATAELYPRFTLSGAFAFEGLTDLFDASRRAWNFGPSFRWNLFNGGRVRNAIRIEEARTEQLLQRYEQTVLQALEEVANALVACHQETLRREALERSVHAAEQSVGLVQTLYRTGLTDFQNVLDMERSLFEQQDALAQSQGLVTQNVIGLYRTLGGGWQSEPQLLVDELQDQKKGEPIF